MKKILSLLFFIPIIGNAQISIGSITGFAPATTNASAFGYSNITLKPNRLYLYCVVVTGAVNNGTMSTSTTTWTNVLNTGDVTRRIQIFRYLSSSLVTAETLNIGSFGGAVSGYLVTVLEVAGVVTSGSNGADAILQTITGSGTGSNPSLTFGSGLGTGSPSVIAIFGNNLNPFGGTVETGFTEMADGGYTDPDAGQYFMYRINNADNTPSVTATSDWIGAALELRTRRRVAVH